ncbi:MAG: flagellar biosynthesis protein FliO [Comamonadaceae bacterium]|nr:MAG: flagellar biosynthesis protein FliO [Comamonadaceae bacterium]
MTQTLLVVVLFVAAMAGLPWLIRRLQQRRSGPFSAAAGVSKVLSAVAVGPQQRVVTVEVGPEHQRTVLVLGVTAQQINCLHVLTPGGAMAAPSTAPGTLPAAAVEPSFAGAMASASAQMERPSHG